MKKLKTIFFLMFYLIIIVALVIIVAENFAFFSTKQSLVFNLKYRIYNLPPIHTGLFIFGAFVVGYFFAYVNGLFLRFQTSRTVKLLNTRMKVQLAELSSLRKEVEFLHRNPAKKPEAPKKEEKKVEKVAEEPKAEPAAEEVKPTVVQN